MAEQTVEEIAGFISGNVKRRQILDVLDKNSRKSRQDLRKITRTPDVILDKVLKDMAERGVVAKEGDCFILTETGEKVAHIVIRQAGKGKVRKYDSNIPREI